MLCFRKFLVAKIFMDKKLGVSQLSVGIFCLTVPTKFVGEPFSLSLASGTKIIYASEGYVTIIRRKVFVSQYRNISQRNPPLQSFRKFIVAKKFVEKKEEGEYWKFPSKTFCLEVPRNFVGEYFNLSLISGVE